MDATGAVVAAGALLGSQAEQIAAIVKMIQNTLIGVVAFLVAVYWVTQIETRSDVNQPAAIDIWYRLPKFIIGFLSASLIFSFVLTPTLGSDRVKEILDLTSDFRGWLFCLAFVSIGLESSFRELRQHATGGRPIQLYITGQTLNLVLTLFASYLAFGGILFDRLPIDESEARVEHVIRYNLDTDRDATGLFYTEVDGWKSWTVQEMRNNSTHPNKFD